MDIFEQAARKMTRIVTVRGAMPVEVLFTMPLTSKNGFDLDATARGVSAELRSLTEDSFVETKPDPRKADLTLQLDLLKHVIASKQEDAKKAKDRSERAVKRQAIVEAIQSKQLDEIKGKPLAELMKELAEIDGD